MKTMTQQTKSKLVDISDYTKDYNNPIVKAFNARGQVFGFAAYFIVAEQLDLTPSVFEDGNFLVDKEGKTYKVLTTKDVSPSFTKGYARSKSGVDIKSFLVLQCDYLVILEQPKDGKSVLTIFKTTDLILDEKGNIL